MKFIFVCIVTVAIAGKDMLSLLSSQRLSSIQNEIADNVMYGMGYEVHMKNDMKLNILHAYTVTSGS